MTHVDSRQTARKLAQAASCKIAVVVTVSIGDDHTFSDADWAILVRTGSRREDGDLANQPVGSVRT